MKRLLISNDPPVREPDRQRDGQPRIKVSGLADRVWNDTLLRRAGEIVTMYEPWPEDDAPAPIPTCACGHVEDEHERHRACTVEDCPCIHYEVDS